MDKMVSRYEGSWVWKEQARKDDWRNCSGPWLLLARSCCWGRADGSAAGEVRKALRLSLRP